MHLGINYLTSVSKIACLLLATTLVGFSSVYAQQPTQTIRGTVTDATTQAPVPYGTITVEGTNPQLGAVADANGNFIINNVPVGRYDIHVSFLGYEPSILKEVLVGSGKEVVLAIAIHEAITEAESVTVKARVNKDKALNEMATASARMFNVEEAQRYAGGFDDPARLASSFAGVSSSVANNGIVIRGNAPKAVSWRMEGVEIPNPNHFADLSTFGGGGLTALSSQMLGNSDFFTGAFPAEYGNALSGVFDLHLRKGNNRTFEHAAQVGLTGLDISSEGPIVSGGQASYLFNYRYSTLTLLEPLLPEDADGINYQDLSFKLHIPTGEAGVLSLWGIGAIDESGQRPELDTTEWEFDADRQSQDVDQSMGALGMNYRWLLSNSAYLHTGVTATGNGTDITTTQLNDQLVLVPEEEINVSTWNYIFSTFLKSKIAAGHSNKTGVDITALNYNLLLQKANEVEQKMETYVDEEDRSYLLSAWTSSSVRVSDAFTINPGLHSQYFTLSKKLSLEPRLGVQWNLDQDQSIALAYGLHGRLERLNYYFLQSNDTAGATSFPNKGLDFSKAHHIVLSYDRAITDDIRLKVEPYYQRLFSIPVRKNSSLSFINMQNDWFLRGSFVNEGEGQNVGLDITLEHFLKNGFYGLLTASVFDSRYKGGDNVWRNTRFNQNYVLNLLAGKEWTLGQEDQNLFGLNVKLTYQGGRRHTPIDQEASQEVQDAVYYENRAFELQDPGSLLLHLTTSFRLNGKGHASVFSLSVINATGVEEFQGDRYNFQTNRIEPLEEALIIPNISYKLEF